MSNEADEGDNTGTLTPRSVSEISTCSTTVSASHPVFTILVGGRFRLSRRLGSGAFGEVFAGIEIATAEPVAIKLEPLISHHQPHLQHEARLYSYLNRGVVTCGIPRVRWFGREGEYNVMVMDLLGPSIEELFEFCNRQFDGKTAAMLVEQMICRIEFLHSMGYLHRDSKPENFCMGTHRRAHHVYLVDMGLCKRYCDLRTREHIPYIEGKSLTGTARYVSINTHLGRQQSRRDDIESLALIAIYLARGSLPWQGIRAPTKQEKYDKIKQLKLRVATADLCRDLPPCFAAFLTYARQLEFVEEPDYDRCRGYFQRYLEENGWRHDYVFAWLLKERSDNQLTESTSEANAANGSPRGRRRSRVSLRNSSVVSQSGCAESVTLMAKSPVLFRSQEFASSLKD